MNRKKIEIGSLWVWQGRQKHVKLTCSVPHIIKRPHLRFKIQNPNLHHPFTTRIPIHNNIMRFLRQFRHFLSFLLQPAPLQIRAMNHNLSFCSNHQMV